jgi:hypothetical protein
LKVGVGALKVVGGLVISGAGVLGTIALAADDATGVGVFDDPAILGTAAATGFGTAMAASGNSDIKKGLATGATAGGASAGAMPPSDPNNNDNKKAKFKDDSGTAKDFRYKDTKSFERGAKQDILKDARQEAKQGGNKELQKFLDKNSNPNIGVDDKGNIWLQSRTPGGGEINTGLPAAGYAN